jgi:hypothetical protein
LELDSDLDARYWLAREYFEDSAAGFYEIALWCDANQLDEARDEHLNDVLRFDPDHAEARRRLGFVLRGGKWTLVEPSIQTGDIGQGKVAPASGSMSRRAEQLETLRKRQEAIRKQQELNKTVLAVVAKLESRNAAYVKQARSDLAEVRDPLAIGPLTKAMQTANVENRIRILQAIGAVQEQEATYALAIAATVDLSPDVRAAAIELLRERPQDRARFVPLLEQALRSEKPGLVYNGAEALVALGERKSVSGVIDALTIPSREDSIPAGKLETDSAPNWVKGLKLTDVWAPNRFVPFRAPS